MPRTVKQLVRASVTVSQDTMKQKPLEVAKTASQDRLTHRMVVQDEQIIDAPMPGNLTECVEMERLLPQERDIADVV